MAWMGFCALLSVIYNFLGKVSLRQLEEWNGGRVVCRDYTAKVYFKGEEDNLSVEH